MLRFAFAIFASAILATAYACSFDTDCYPGSQCVRKTGQIYGICVGGILPGNRNDRQPVQAPLDPNKTYGNTCSFDTECGPGSVCVKRIGIEGACMKQL